MSSLRLQWRGALMVLAAWAALAAAQAQQPARPGSSVSSAPVRIVTVTENGKTIRCRLVQTWHLADGSTAHKLQAVESGEFITILDDPMAAPRSGAGLPKRIFHWGLRNGSPPAGIPAPPVPQELMVDSGVVLRIDTNSPQGGPVVPAGAVVSGPTSPYKVGGPNPFLASSAVVSTPMAVGTCNSSGPCTSGCDLENSPPSLREKIQNWFANKNTSGIVSAPKAVVVPAETKVIAAPLSPPPEQTLVITTPAPAPAPLPLPVPIPVPAEKSLAIIPPLQKSPAVSPPSEKSPAIVAPAQKSLAQTTAPSSAQPARTEIVAAVTKSDIARQCPTIGTTLPPVSMAVAEVAPAKLDLPPPTPPSATVVPAKVDILTTPERFIPADKLKAKSVTVGVAIPVAAVVAPPAPEKRRTGMPPGAASVLAARNGLDGPIAYIPVQAAVVPQPWRAPVPPDPKTPDAPQLNAYVNAFSAPPQPRGPDGPQVYGPGPQAMPYGPMMANGYPSQGMMNPYGPSPYAMMNPYGMPQGMPYGYGYPVMQTAYPMMPMQQQPPQTMGPRTYQGPMAPNPVGNSATQTGVQPIAYTQPMVPYYQPAVLQASAAQPAPAPQFTQFIDKLRDSPFPAERERAAYQLSGFDWRANPQVAKALVRGAAQDPAPTVRVGCVVTLTRMNIATAQVMGVLQDLRTDADPRVRDAAEQAIARLGQLRTAKAN